MGSKFWIDREENLVLLDRFAGGTYSGLLDGADVVLNTFVIALNILVTGESCSVVSLSITKLV